MPPILVTLGDLVADLIVPLAELPVQPLAHQVARDIMVEAGSTGSSASGTIRSATKSPSVTRNGGIDSHL